MNYGSSFCFTCKSTFKSWLCKFSIPEGRTYSPLPCRAAVVSLPLVGPVRSAEGYPLLTGSTDYAAIHPPSFVRYTCRRWLPAKSCHWHLFCRGTWLFPCSFIVQRYSQEGDDRYRNLPYVGKSDQPWRRPLRCRRFCLFKLQPYVQ